MDHLFANGPQTHRNRARIDYLIENEYLDVLTRYRNRSKGNGQICDPLGRERYQPQEAYD